MSDVGGEGKEGTSSPTDLMSSDGAKGGGGQRGRSCAGVLYFSSERRSKGRSPLCVGFSRRESEVSDYVAGKFEQDDTKDGKALLDFKYACVGYSVHRHQVTVDHQAATSDVGSNKQAELPFCMGIEVLAARRDPQGVGSTRQEHVSPKHDDKSNEAATILPRPPSSVRSPSAIGGFTPEEFSSRFIRSAGLVATGVKKNLNRLGNSIKAMATDIFYPDRGRPK